MRVVITGGAGYIESRTAKKPRLAGIEVIVQTAWDWFAKDNGACRQGL